MRVNLIFVFSFFYLFWNHIGQSDSFNALKRVTSFRNQKMDTIEDHHLHSSSFSIKPDQFFAHSWMYENPYISPLIHGEKIRVSLLDEDFWKRLDRKDRKKMFESLKENPVKVSWETKNFLLKSKKTHLANAIMLNLAVKNKIFILKKLYAINPMENSWFFFQKKAKIINPHFVSELIFYLVKNMKEEELGLLEARAIPKLVSEYMRQEGKKKATKNKEALKDLLLDLGHKIDQSEELTVKQRGILLGAILSGCLMHGSRVKKNDERKIFIIDAVANLVWASTSYIGMMPMATLAGVALAGSLSVAAVTTEIILTRKGARDIAPSIKEIEGLIQFHASNKAKTKEDKEKVHEWFSWVSTTIHVNGFSD